MLPFELTKDTPYLALSGELWSVFYEYFNRNWPCYKGFLLYSHTGVVLMGRARVYNYVVNKNIFPDAVDECVSMLGHASSQVQANKALLTLGGEEQLRASRYQEDQ